MSPFRLRTRADLTLLEQDRDCKGLRHRCTAPVPELFHHHKVVGEKSIGSEGDPALQDFAWVGPLVFRTAFANWTTVRAPTRLDV